MHLHRVTPDPFENHSYSSDGKFLGTSSQDFKASTFGFAGEPRREVVVAHFARFGGGEKRQSDFDVVIEWDDLKKILEKFCEAGHPEACKMRQAIALAAAVQALGWEAPKVAPPQSN